MFALPFVAVIVTTSFATTSVFAADCARSYTVQDGDICDSISAAKNVSTYQLAVVNPQINSACSNLLPGQVLCLGTTATNEDCTTTYIVQSDDNCDLITQGAGVNATILGMNNPQVNDNCSNIYVGEVLCIAGTVQVPPAPTGFVTPDPVIPAGQDEDSEDDDNLPFCDEL